MVEKKSIRLALFFLLAGLAYLRAGDTATFVDLGFSSDGKVYMFGQYGVQTRTYKPWAELYGVDIFQNDYVAGGRLSYTHEGQAIPGQDGSGAFFRLIGQHSALADRYGVNFLFQGPSLYLALDGAAGGGPETIEFRDFEQGSSYKATLISLVEGSGSKLRSAFSIAVERVGQNGVKQRYIAGNPEVKRALVPSYRIRRVIIDPRKHSLIFVIEFQKMGADGLDLRYMVEALHL
ncbi:MAG: DUF2259 domain-containing protein [Treponema sp.]|nr:DUF2259 domain-containing protein [Treponema sp.]